jgi:DNA-binding SARP family transcriptional activator
MAITTEVRDRFQVLGPVTMWREGRELDLGPKKQRALLGLLLLNVGSTVRVPTIVETIWGERPPRNANNTVQVHISRIRRILRTPGAETYGNTPTEPLETVASGYRLCLEPASVDIHLFRILLARAQSSRSEGRLCDALTAIERALDLWREDILADVDESIRSRMAIDPLLRHRRQAVIELADMAIELGQPGRAVAMLEAQAGVDLTDEPVHARLILTYGAAGRRAAALHAYESIRRVLADTLGVDPSAELKQAHTTVLRL